MRIELSNGRQFIIKLSYTKKYKTSFKKDEYGREIYISWVERDTICKVEEWFKRRKSSTITYTGFAHCHYMDKFDKIIGRNLAYYKALESMLKNKTITMDEYDEMTMFELNCQVKVMKKMNTNEVTNG